MIFTKRDLRNHGQVLIDQNGNLNVNNGVIRGDLKVHGKIINVYAPDPETIVERPLVTPQRKMYCELTIDEGHDVHDNELFQWKAIDDEFKMFDGRNTIVIPLTAMYSVNIRVYSNGGNEEFDDSGSGISLWINDEHIYSFATSTGTSFISSVQKLTKHDHLQVKSILTTNVISGHQQAYTFQVAEI